MCRIVFMATSRMLQAAHLLGKAMNHAINQKQLVACGLWLVAYFTISVAPAQTANNWINFNQSYFKIPVSKDGIYRITYSDLQSANFPVNSVDPRLIQIFHRGVEQAIFVQGESDAVFNINDFIEFFGQRNDGTLDRKLYQPASAQLNPNYNLYSDTTAYFLTYRLIPPAGKRMDLFSEVNVTNIPKDISHNEQRMRLITGFYSGGFKQGDELQFTSFDQGEGWTGQPIKQNESVDYVVDLITNSVPVVSPPQLEMLVVGYDGFQHVGQVQVGTSLRTVSNLNFFGYDTQVISVPLQWSDVSIDGKLAVRLSASSASNNRFQMAVCSIKVTFPQSFSSASASEKFYFINPNPSNKSYIEIDNPATGLRMWDVTDENNVYVIGTRTAGSSLSTVVNNTSVSRKIFTSNAVNTASVKPISFRNLAGTKANFIVITHRSLTQAAGGYSNPVQAYATYRASVQGGKYDTLTLTMDQLYNQFNYGETSSLAIYECMRYLVAVSNPKFLFLIGKGRDIYSYSAYQRKPPTTGEVKDLVPSAGLPGADMAFSAGIGGSTFDPKVATGRLPAINSLQVASYLNKIKEIESAPVADSWKKSGLHLSGGIQAFELPLFRSYVDGFKQIASSNFWGASISTIGKRDPNPVQLINVSDQINKGVNMITFFGHSSPGTIDIDIGFVSDPVLGYNNLGKYPVFLINGCNAGAFFLNGVIFGEDWILSSNKGARNFIAHSSFGFPNTLRAYSDLFYQVGFADSVFIKKGVGEVQQEVAKRYLGLYGNSISSVTQIQQMMMLGDPAVKLFGTAKPDFAIDDTSVSLQTLDGAPITALSSSFGLKIIVKNLGATTSRPMPVRVVRTFTDNTSLAYDSIFNSPKNQDTIIFNIKRDAKGGGQNIFSVTIDPNNTVAETNKLNNSTVFSALIPSNATKNLFPAPFSMVNKTASTFVFQSTNLLADKRDFQFELDTTNAFSSPFLKKQIANAKVLAKISLNLLSRDSTTYYWRTRLDKPTASESAEWNVSSFTYINNGPEGWGQFQFPQLLDNGVEGLLKDAQEQQLKYLETVIPVSISTYGSNFSPPTSTSVRINGVEYNLGSQGQPCRTNTINMIAFDKSTGVPYAGIPFNFQDPRTCGREPQVINSFLVNETETGLGDDLVTAISNLKQSDSVVLFSIGNPSYSTWSTALKSKLAELGIATTQLTSLQDGEPLVVYGRKNAVAGTAKVFRTAASPSTQQSLMVNKTISARFSSGTLKSSLIGPANKWFSFRGQVVKAQVGDAFSYRLYGVRLNGVEDLLFANVSSSQDLSSVSTAVYPYLRVVLQMQDPVSLTPVQLKKWFVTYETVAEGILVYRGNSSPQTVQEGQSIQLPFSFVNISTKNFASQLTVTAAIVSKTIGANKQSMLMIAPPSPNDSTKFQMVFDTRGKVGLNDVSVFVNPRILPEQYYDNNALLLTDYLNVKKDNDPPILEVRVDGRELVNNDFVSPNPQIVVAVKDSNPYLFKTDTIGVTLFLQSCATCNFKPIYFKGSDVTWSPATATTNFQLNFNPINLAPNTYTLRAQAQDASGNKSGVKPYEVNFRVAETNSLELRSVYPNPSSGAFYFNFVLSGNALPSEFSLQIVTLEGKILQNFTTNDVSLFRIGINELTWNGSDDRGQLMPNGLYLYKLNLMVDGKSYLQQGKLAIVK